MFVSALAALLSSLAVAAAPASPPTVGEEVQAAHQAWRNERAATALEDFFTEGEVRNLRHAVAIDPTTSATVSFSRRHHWAEETVTIDGEVVSSQSGGTVVWTVQRTDSKGRTTQETRRFSSGEMPEIDTRTP